MKRIANPVQIPNPMSLLVQLILVAFLIPSLNYKYNTIITCGNYWYDQNTSEIPVAGEISHYFLK